MVKPIFPSSRGEGPRPPPPSSGTSGHSTHDFRDGEPLTPPYAEAFLPNSLADSDGRSPQNYMSFAPQTSEYGCLYSQSFQSYDGSLPSNLPTPAPRDRLSSLPEQEDFSAGPVLRQRRRSAPVGIGLGNEEGVSSSSTDYGNFHLPPDLQDIAVKGHELFWFILSEEVKAQEAAAPGRLSALTISPSPERMQFLNKRGRFGGRTLQQIAKAFSHSSQRKRVREYAESINLQSLNYNSFSDLLFGLFQEGGVTQARVLVLFFFCADVALCALRENLTKHFQQLVDWTSRYITEKLSSWVHEHGGWAAVLQESMDQAYKFAVIGVCVVGFVALSTFLLRKLKC